MGEKGWLQSGLRATVVDKGRGHRRSRGGGVASHGKRRPLESVSAVWKTFCHVGYA